MTNTTGQFQTTPRISGLVVSGLTQIAIGALTGFPYALAAYRPELLGRLRVRAPARIRQLHLDLIMMGALATATGAALPQLPRAVESRCFQQLDQRTGVRATGARAVDRELAPVPDPCRDIIRHQRHQLGRRRRDRPSPTGRAARPGIDEQVATWLIGLPL